MALSDYQQKTLPYIVSWSGGKDSCLALHRAMQKWGKPCYLINMLTESGLRSRSHGLDKKVLQAQADALEIPIQFYATSWNDYEHTFKMALQEAHQKGIKSCVFGDVRVPQDPDWQNHRVWADQVCAHAGLIAEEPLWEETQERLLEEFFNFGFKAKIIAVNSKCLGQSDLGKILSPSLIHEFKQQGIDPLGEKGEFHTLVMDGPLFSGPLELCEKDPVYKDGYWFLDLGR